MAHVPTSTLTKQPACACANFEQKRTTTRSTNAPANNDIYHTLTTGAGGWWCVTRTVESAVVLELDHLSPAARRWGDVVDKQGQVRHQPGAEIRRVLEAHCPPQAVKCHKGWLCI